MKEKLNLNDQIQTLLSNYGQRGLETAKSTIYDKNVPIPVREVLKYFIEETWPNTHHPALIALCCEAVGGKADVTRKIGAALVLLTGAADIHDDIIDKSKTKGGKRTVYDKFDKDLVLLAGDALLFKGLLFLHETCEELPPRKRRAIFSSIEQSFFKIGNAAIGERGFKAKPGLDPKKYRKIIAAKGAVSGACAEIGAVIGDGKIKEVNALRHFGRTLGILMTVRNEFADLRDSTEMKNRMKNEVPPLPLLYALQDVTVKPELTSLLQGRMTKQKAERVAEIVFGTEQVQELEKEMLSMKKIEEKLLETIRGKKEPFKLLLQLSTDYLLPENTWMERALFDGLDCLPSNLTLHFTAERSAPLGQALSAWDV